jgi:uncharacterized protein YfbU (UPF0304 family)
MLTAPRHALAGILLLPILTTTFAVASRGDDKKSAQAKNVLKGKQAEELVALKLEVDALEKLYHLELNARQQSAFLALAAKTAAKTPAVKEVQAGAEYRKVLKELHDALLNEEADRIRELSAKLDELQEKETIVIDDEFEMSDAALKSAPQAFKLLSAAQIVAYLAALDDEVPDPVERLLSAVEEGEDLTGDEWKELRDETAEEVSWLTAGFHTENAAKVKNAVTTWLDRNHRLKGDELSKEWPALEKSAHQLIGNVSALVVIQHYMERELAELLSNPRTAAAMRKIKK